MNKFKKWWFGLTHVKCNYCKEPLEEYYDACLFPIENWKGNIICKDCIKKESKLSKNETIIYI